MSYYITFISFCTCSSIRNQWYIDEIVDSLKVNLFFTSNLKAVFNLYSKRKINNEDEPRNKRTSEQKIMFR